MADATLLLSEIEDKVVMLSGKWTELLKKNENFQKEIIELKKENQEQQERIRQIEENLRILKSAKTLENKEGTTEAKARINELLREIDKCMGLLNT